MQELTSSYLPSRDTGSESSGRSRGAGVCSSRRCEKESRTSQKQRMGLGRSWGHYPEEGRAISVVWMPCARTERNREGISLWRRGSVDLRGQMCRRGAGNTVGVLLARGRSRQWLITITHSIDSLSLILLLYTHHRHVGGRKSKYSAGSSSVSSRCSSRYCRGGEGGGALQHFYIGKPTMGDGWVV